MDRPLSSWGYGLDLFVPPPMLLVPRKKVQGEKALPSVAPTASKGRTRSIIPRKTDPPGVGDWLTDTLCWLNQEALRCGGCN